MNNGILSKENISLSESLNTQDQVFNRIVDIAYKGNLINSKSKIIKGLKKREDQSTTGFLDGFAIPHVFSKEVISTSIVILTTANGVDWKSLDGKLTSFFITLLIPKDSQNEHLKILSSISRLLMDEEIRNRLLSVNNKDEIYDLLNPVVNL